MVQTFNPKLVDGRVTWGKLGGSLPKHSSTSRFRDTLHRELVVSRSGVSRV